MNVLTDYRFLVSVKMAYIRTSFDLAISGTLHYDNEMHSDAAVQRPELRRVDIATMCTVLHKGGTFSLAKAEEAVAIYDLVTNHLDDFVTLSKQRINIELPPPTQLAALDALAFNLFPLYLRFRPDTGPTGTGFRPRSNSLSNSLRTNQNSPLTPLAPIVEEYKERSPIIAGNIA